MRKIGSTQSRVHSELFILSNIIFRWFKVALKISTKWGKDNWILIGNSIVANENHQGKEWSIIFSWGQRTRFYAAGKQISAKKIAHFSIQHARYNTSLVIWLWRSRRFQYLRRSYENRRCTGSLKRNSDMGKHILKTRNKL